jgi:hypothetical protein
MFDKALDVIAAQRESSRKLTITGMDLGTTKPCPVCGEQVELREMTNGYRTIRYWSDCTCLDVGAAKAQELIAQSLEVQVRQRVELPATDLRAIQHLTLDTLRGNGIEQPLAFARRWLSSILRLPVAPGYNDGQPCALYLYSQGKGRGKTHLAAGIALAAASHGKLVAWADEISYIERYWAASLEQKATLSRLPGEQAWLAILDDMGQRESTPASLRDAWYDVLNPRWLKRGWTIVTSNKTPEELVQNGTLNDASYSRLVQMTRGQYLAFNGTDYRLGATP